MVSVLNYGTQTGAFAMNLPRNDPPLRIEFRMAALAAACFLVTFAAGADTSIPEAVFGGPAKVVYATDFESEDWLEPWGHAGHKGNLRLVRPEETGRADGLDGKALEVTIQKDGHYGAGPMFFFKEQLGYQPDAAYARFDLYLAEDWLGYGGKSPGWSGTEAAGWGGKPSDGTNGWSARGSLRAKPDGTYQMGYYTYHAEMKGQYGDFYAWDAPLPLRRWHRIEQYCKINTPGKKDGVLRAWIDGKLVLDKRDVMMRTEDTLQLKAFWLNFYHGGKRVSGKERHAYLDNLVLAVAGPDSPDAGTGSK